MTKEQMTQAILEMGVKSRFKPYWIGEGAMGTIFLEVRKTATIQDGIMSGSEIDVYDPKSFRVWTSRKIKAVALAKAHNLKIRLFDKEAEIIVPATLADAILPGLGAKIKRTMSEAQKATLAKGAKLFKFRAQHASGTHSGQSE